MINWYQVILVLQKECFSIITAFIAVVALIISSKQNKKIEEIDERTKPNFDFEIHDANILKSSDYNEYLFRLVIVNLSDSANSLKNVTLNILYENKNIHSTVGFNYDISKVVAPMTDLERFPVNVDGRKSVGVSVQFSIKNEFFSDKNVNEYNVIIEDIFGFKKIDKKTIINEVFKNE